MTENPLVSMKLPKQTLDKVRGIVKETKHTISGFIVLAIDEKAEKLQEEKKRLKK